MRALSVHITGFRRFGAPNRPLDISDELIAIVGPNEAGKTSLLHALQHMNNTDAFEQSDLTRGGDGNVCVTVRYAVEEVERKLLGLRYSADASRRLRELSVSKFGDGSIEGRLDGEVPETAKLIAGHLQTLKAATDDLSKMYDEGIVESIEELVAAAEGGEYQRAPSNAVMKALREHKPADAAARKLQLVVEQFLRLAVTDVRQAMATTLAAWRPRFLLFTPSDRSLRASYPLNDERQWNPALQNLFALAGVDRKKLAAAVGDIALTKTLLDQPNQRIQEKMNAAWRQGKVTVRFEVDGGTLHVLAYDAGGSGFLPITSRSEGLRQFLGIMAFVERHKEESEDDRPILLLDEAEQHLHYDAQADLINVLTEQQFARKVIYTTHSAGCLPADLGTGVRAITTARSDGLNPDADDDLSVPENRFWQMGGSGYSPLLLAMGATTFAFTAARRAVLTEGFTDLVLLPSLIREATKQIRLDYQVVPGLARVADGDIAELAESAVNVAYLVDGDDAGARIHQRLTDAGVPRRALVSLRSVTGGAAGEPEDLLRPEVFVDALNDVLGHVGGPTFAMSDLANTGRWATARRWAEQHGLKLDKRHFALAVLERRHDGLLSTTGRRHIAKLHTALTKALAPPRRRSRT